MVVSILWSSILILLLMTAAVCDVASRTVPNSLSLFIAFTGIPIRIWAAPTVLASFWATVALMLVLLFLYARHLLGGGDVKLMVALSLALTAVDCYRFVIATALFGGLLAIIYLLLRRALPPLRCRPDASRLLRVAVVEAWRIRRGLPLPYGVAIAAGGIFVLLHPTSW
jgi:prepilin peptidase CpaA